MPTLNISNCHMKSVFLTFLKKKHTFWGTASPLWTTQQAAAEYWLPSDGAFAERLTAEPPAHSSHSGCLSRPLHLGLHRYITKEEQMNVSRNSTYITIFAVLLLQKQSSSCFGAMPKMVIPSRWKLNWKHHHLKMTLSIWNFISIKKLCSCDPNHMNTQLMLLIDFCTFSKVVFMVLVPLSGLYWDLGTATHHL